MNYEGGLDNDFHCIIIWNSNQDLISKIESRFNSHFVYKQVFNLNSEEKLDKLKQVYYPVDIKDYDLRINSDSITFYIIRLFHSYEYVYRSEGYRLCNKEILDFKLDVRKQYDYINFHCTDNVSETIQCLKAFNLDRFLPATRIVETKDIYHFIYGGETLTDSLFNHNFKLINLKDSPVVKYLQGFPNEYDTGSTFFKPRPSTISYLLEQNPKYNLSYHNYEITVCKYKDKYIVVDGMHRSSILYYYGFRHLFVKEIYIPDLNVPFLNYLNDNTEFPIQENSHLENFNKFIFDLNNSNIRYVVIRGFKNMPFTADTDLDIIIHKDDYNRFIDFTQSQLNNTVNLVNSKTYSNNCFYSSYQTVGTLGDNLENHCYQLDVYSDAFFFASENESITLPDEFINYIFNTKEKYLNFYIPNNYSELILLICRSYFDKFGVFTEKHKDRIFKLLNEERFNKFEYLNIYEKLFHIHHIKDKVNYSSKDIFFLGR